MEKKLELQQLTKWSEEERKFVDLPISYGLRIAFGNKQDSYTNIADILGDEGYGYIIKIYGSRWSYQSFDRDEFFKLMNRGIQQVLIARLDDGEE